MRHFLLTCAAVVGTAALSLADDAPAPAPLHPAALPSPALKYRLLPDLRTQTAGNAVPLYEDAIAKLKPLKRDADELPKWRELFSQWAEMPVKELPRDEVRKALEPYKDIFDLIDKAARREFADWDLPARLRKGGLATLLPEVQFLREMATLLSVRARLEMADGNLSAALHTLQTGLALAKQTGEQPTLINNLVGAAIAQLMLRQLDDFVRQPKAPNLYWALTDLPRPLVDQRKSFDGERLWAYGMFPGIGEALADLNAGPITEEQVQACVKMMLNDRGPLDLPSVRRKLELTKYVTDHYEENKKILVAQGRPKEQVEKMPHIQVALLIAMTGYEALMDEQMKWYNEPYYKAADQLDAAMKAIKAKPAYPGVLPSEALSFLAPAVGKIFTARTRLQRRIDALRCVEAIRAYAAGHDGKPPDSLDAIQDVPLPLDPATGKTFAYKLTDGKALLTAPAVTRDGQRVLDELTYDVTIER